MDKREAATRALDFVIEEYIRYSYIPEKKKRYSGSFNKMCESYKKIYPDLVEEYRKKWEDLE